MFAKFQMLSLTIFSVGLLSGCASNNAVDVVSFDQVDTMGSSTVVSTDVVSTQQPTNNGPALITLGRNDNVFEIVRKAQGTVLIDFYADWCGPCKKQGSVLHELEHLASVNKARIIKINVDQHEQLARQFQVTSLPTMLVVKDGEIVDRLSGFTNRTRVASLLSR